MFYSPPPPRSSDLQFDSWTDFHLDGSVHTVHVARRPSRVSLAAGLAVLLTQCVEA